MVLSEKKYFLSAILMIIRIKCIRENFDSWNKQHFMCGADNSGVACAVLAIIGLALHFYLKFLWSLNFGYINLPDL